MARAAQDKLNDETRKTVVPVLVHGECGVCEAKGSCIEVLQMESVKSHCWRHDSHRSLITKLVLQQMDLTLVRLATLQTPRKMTFTPVIHANGDDVESCVRAMDIALRYRQEFSKDVVINMDLLSQVRSQRRR